MSDETEPIPSEPVASEINDLKVGYARNRRRSRIGLALGVLALVLVLIITPVGFVLLARQNELRDLQRTSDCRSRLAAAHDNATDELWSRAISVPQDIDGARAAVTEADRINELRLMADPCDAVRKLGPVIPARPPTNANSMAR